MKKYYTTVTKAFIALALALPVLIMSCKNDADEPEVKAPSNLVYNPSTISPTFGTAMSSNTPTVSGGTPITYTVTTIPSAAVSIDANTGVITVENTVAVGSYKATVVAKNSVGSTTFTDALTVNVTAIANPTTFDADIKPIITGNCSPCHNAGGSSTTYVNYANAKGSVNSILNRIKRTQGSSGFMPQNGTKLSDANIALIEKWQSDGLVEK